MATYKLTPVSLAKIVAHYSVPDCVQASFASDVNEITYHGTQVKVSLHDWREPTVMMTYYPCGEMTCAKCKERTTFDSVQKLCAVTDEYRQHVICDGFVCTSCRDQIENDDEQGDVEVHYLDHKEFNIGNRKPAKGRLGAAIAIVKKLRQIVQRRRSRKALARSVALVCSRTGVQNPGSIVDAVITHFNHHHV
jgi:hypothetical protein